MPAQPSASDIKMVDGQFAFGGGVNSGKTPQIASPVFPHGLQRDQLAWLANGTVRGDAITQRTGWRPLVQGVDWPGIYQGGFMYSPDAANPHLILKIGGQLYRIRVDTDNSVQNLSAIFGLSDPPDVPQSYFVQGEQFLIIQTGDLVTNPLFYNYNGITDVTQLRRSNGFISVGNAANEIPPATAMDYHGNRILYAIGNTWIGGDIVHSIVSGTAPYDFRDSILHCTENPIAKAGDGLSVPNNAGTIRALKHTANLDTALGQSPLFIFTRSTVFLSDLPVSRDAWKLIDQNTRLLQRVGLIKGGTYSERSVVAANADLFYNTTPNGDVISFSMAVRYFQQQSNTRISENLNRILRFNDRSLLHFASAIEFDNRLWMCQLPVTTPVGAAFTAVTPLDFDVLSSMEERLPPAWEGHYEGLDFLQLFESDFGGLQRAFGVIYSRKSGQIEIWELTQYDRWDSQVGNNGDNVPWYIEFPSYDWGNPKQPKKLVGGGLFIDKLLGTVTFRLQYRPDQHPCWIDWHVWSQCTAKDCTEDIDAICAAGYPVELLCEAYEPDIDFPKPRSKCVGNRKKRPSDIGYQFQARLFISGWCRVRALVLYAEPYVKPAYDNILGCNPPIVL